MTSLGALFYLFAAIILASAALSVTRRNPAHAVACAVVTFLGLGALLTILGAPLPGVLLIVVYAGAIMILFLFVVMLLGLESPTGTVAPARLIMPGVLGAATLVSLLAVIGRDPRGQAFLPAAMAGPNALGRLLFDRWWLAVEAVSILLFAALAAVILLGQARRKQALSGGDAA